MTPPRIALALVCGLVLRTSCLGVVAYNFTEGDAASYRYAASVLAEHHVFSYSPTPPYEPTAYRPPGYVFFIAAVSHVSSSVLATQLAQIALSLATAVLLALIARRLAPGTEGLVLWGAVLNPFDAVYAGAGLSECFTAALMVGSAASLVLLDGWRQWVVAGLALGLLCLSRDIYLALIPFGAIAFLVAGGRVSLKPRFVAALRVGLVAALVVLPWTIRNYAHFGRFVPVSAGRLGYSLWMGAWAVDGSFTLNDATGRTYPDVAFLVPTEREIVAKADADIATSEPVFKRLFVERFKAEPLRVIGRWLIRWPRLWFGTRFDIFELNPTLFPRGSLQWTAAKALLFLLNALLMLGMAVGAVIATRARSPMAWALTPIAFTALIYLPLNSFENRYSQPMFPFVTLLFAVAASAAERRLRSRAASQAVAS